jgi:hypothetical protein
MEMPGIDPGAYRMQSDRSTKWATSPRFCFIETFYTSFKMIEYVHDICGINEKKIIINLC